MQERRKQARRRTVQSSTGGGAGGGGGAAPGALEEEKQRQQLATASRSHRQGLSHGPAHLHSGTQTQASETMQEGQRVASQQMLWSVF